MLTSNDQRFYIYTLLDSYIPFDALEQKSKTQIMDFIENNQKCFENTFIKGNVTGSALVTNENFDKVLLTHHAKLDRWFQFGGHSDGNPNTLAVGRREAEEESNLANLKYLPGFSGIFDLDVHPIPESNKMPLHNHFDIRILLIADEKEPFIVTKESKDLKWLTIEEASEYNTQPAFLRMLEKLSYIKRNSYNKLNIWK